MAAPPLVEEEPAVPVVGADWPPPPELPVPEPPLAGALATGTLPEPFSVVPEPAPVPMTDVEYGGTQRLCEGGAAPASTSQGSTTADPSTRRAGSAHAMPLYTAVG